MHSPYHPYSDITINEKGADDIEEDEISKKSIGEKRASKTIITND